MTYHHMTPKAQIGDHVRVEYPYGDQVEGKVAAILTDGDYTALVLVPLEGAAAEILVWDSWVLDITHRAPAYSTAASRNTDPETSHQAERRHRLTWNSQQFRILSAFDKYGPMCDEEAGELTGLAQNRAGYWKRCSELRKMGYIMAIGTCESTTGNEVTLSDITSAGRQALADVAVTR